MTSVYVGGVNVASLGFVGDVSWSHQWPGGCWDASWSVLGVPTGLASRYLHPRADVGIYVGTERVWAGTLDDVDGSGSFSAAGYSRRAEKHLSVDGSGALTTNMVTAINTAVTNGIGWTFYGAAPTGVATTEPQYLSQALDTAATATSQRWGVNARREFYYDVDPTIATLIVAPRSAIVGTTDESFISRIYGTYLLSGALTTVTAISTLETPATFSAQYVDLRPRGNITTGEAQNIINGMLAKAGARVVFNNGITVGAHQLLTIGGRSVNPATITAGRMVRVYGAINPDGSAVPGGSVDFVIGKTQHAAGSGQITLTPVQVAPRNLSEVLAVTPLEQEVA